MASIDIKKLQERFAGAEVEIAIQDREGGDQPPVVSKSIKKVQLCPDGTHLRFYFDDFYFLAVPFASQVTESAGLWSAADEESGLTYTFKKVQVF